MLLMESQVDANWWRGSSSDGRSGFFPSKHVELALAAVAASGAEAAAAAAGGATPAAAPAAFATSPDPALPMQPLHPNLSSTDFIAPQPLYAQGALMQPSQFDQPLPPVEPLADAVPLVPLASNCRWCGAFKANASCGASD